MRKMLCVVVTSMGILFANCNSPVFTPIASPNPWQDDYSFLSSMDNYRLWGTYNVYDPSCRKLGDYYYMYSTDAILGENRQEAEEKNVPLGYIPRTLSNGSLLAGLFRKYRRKLWSGYVRMPEVREQRTSGLLI